MWGAQIIAGIMILLICFAAMAKESENLQIGAVTYDGCGAAAGRVSLNSKQDILSIFLNKNIVEAGRRINSRLESQTCNIKIPLQVAKGYSLSISDVSYQSEHHIPRGALSRISFEYALGAMKASKLYRILAGPFYHGSSSEVASEDNRIGSICGGSVDLKVQVSTTVQANDRADQITSSLGSAEYHLQLTHCEATASR